MGLARYRKKRDFTETAEPRGGKKGSRHTGARAPIFVVQQHHASHEHFDFRLESGGTLKSWAVPKGPSLDPADKRLAVEVEDHPIEYAGFEGTIPEGNYGAGSVIVWDRGTWDVEGSAEAALRSGSFTFTLHGEKLKGLWKLVRMKDRAGEARHNWLLIKERDRFAKARTEFDVVVRKPKSVLSGRAIGEVGEKPKRGAPVPRKAGSARGARTPKRAGPKRAGDKREDEASHLPGAHPGAPPPTFRPHLATLVERVPQGAEWVHEVKFDGYRILAHLERGGVRLITRNGHDWSAKFPEVRRGIEEFGFESGILDGEIVALDERGISTFQGLQKALREGTDGLVYYIFDVPYFGGLDLTGCTLAVRTRHLAGVIGKGGPRVRLSEHIDGHGAKVLTQACRLRLEGIVSKRADSLYVSGRASTWVKVKCGRRQEFVIGGYTEPKGSRAGFGALELGYFDDSAHLVHAGKVGAGFDQDDLASLGKRLKSLERAKPAFLDPPLSPGQHWVAPRLVAEVAFTEWTGDGKLRHPVFVGLREDKEASDVKRERARPATARNVRATSAPKPRPKAASTTGDALVAGVRISHPERIVFEGTTITKLDLARYYEAVAEQILPHLVNRPLSLLRCPDGSRGACFFQKHVAVEKGSGLKAVEVRESKGVGVYAAATNLRGVIGLVQMNTLEFHAWGARVDDVERPDRLVLDLDPGEDVPWKQVVEGAELLRRGLEAVGLRSFVMTSGGKGLHVVVPIQRRIVWEEAKGFARSLGLALEGTAPERFVVNMSKAKRGGKVFVDYLRVQRGATSIAPYSSRARPGAPVAMPVEWEEIARVKPAGFTVANAAAHIASRRRDPWEEYGAVRQAVPARAMAKERSA